MAKRTQPQEPVLLTRQEVAARLNLGLRTLDRYVQQGILPQPAKIGRAVRFHRQDIDRLIAGKFPGVEACEEGGEAPPKRTKS